MMMMVMTEKILAPCSGK